MSRLASRNSRYQNTGNCNNIQGYLSFLRLLITSILVSVGFLDFFFIGGIDFHVAAPFPGSGVCDAFASDVCQ